MPGLVQAIVLSAALTSAGTPCSGDATADDYHLEDVCSVWLEGEPAYSVTYGASLTPRPASQQVLIYRREGEWFMRIAGFRWEPEGEVVTRRKTIVITHADAETITNRVTVALLERLSQLPFYGSDDQICMDGASYRLAMSQAGRRYDAGQHSCAGETEVNATAAIFRELALKYDPDFDGLLSGLRD